MSDSQQACCLVVHISQIPGKREENFKINSLGITTQKTTRNLIGKDERLFSDKPEYRGKRQNTCLPKYTMFLDVSEIQNGIRLKMIMFVWSIKYKGNTQ